MKKAYISKDPFALPRGKNFVGWENYARGIEKTDFVQSFGWTLFITVGSVCAIILCTSMCAWYICRVKNAFTKGLYMLCMFSMIVPFQMVMFTLSKTANILHLSNPWGLIIIYLVLDLKKYKTISIAIQYLKGGYGSINMGPMMGCLVLAIVPIVIFYLFCQKHITEGVVAGAVKG